MDYESTLLTKPECLVYRLPPRTTVRGYRAADWGLDKPAWTGRMRVTAKGKAVSIKVIHSIPILNPTQFYIRKRFYRILIEIGSYPKVKS